MITSTPTLYYYEHCPYCVRILTLVGMAKISINRKILLNDDEETPIAMIGAKMLPILETAPEVFMGESLDIMAYLSQTYRFPLAHVEADITAVNTLLQAIGLPLRSLTMPRWIKMPFEEFTTPSAISYFVSKKTQTIGDFDKALANTEAFSTQLGQSLNNASELFEQLDSNPQSYAAIMLFSALYGLGCVQGLSLPSAAQTFMQTMSLQSGLVFPSNIAV